MRFHLIYSGSLRGSGNKSRPDEVMRIRRELSPQLKHLWKTHNALKVLERDGAINLAGGTIRATNQGGSAASMRELSAMFPNAVKDLCGNIQVGEKFYDPWSVNP